MKFRKKPVVVEAIQFTTESAPECVTFMATDTSNVTGFSIVYVLDCMSSVTYTRVMESLTLMVQDS